jgi:DNA-binding transcriptional MerR regulator/effector-binding domain-containing protein
MGEKKLFSIGDVAKMFHISVSSLRHYEALGLLSPEKIDANSGYRYYSARQFEVLNNIRYLRALDMPLPEIADFLGNRDVDRIEEKLQQQKDAVIKKQHELARAERKIDNLLNRLNVAQNAKLDCIELTMAAPCRIVWMDDSLEINGFLDMEAPIRRLEHSKAEAVVSWGKIGLGITPEHLERGEFSRYDGIFLVLDDVDIYDGETQLLPETECVRVLFRGSHGEAPERYVRLLDYIRAEKLKITGLSREVNLIDYGITNDTEKFVTEIIIPVTRIE